MTDVRHLADIEAFNFLHRVKMEEGNDAYNEVIDALASFAGGDITAEEVAVKIFIILIENTELFIDFTKFLPEKMSL